MRPLYAFLTTFCGGLVVFAVTAAVAGPTPEHHAACLQAADYAGCVRAQATSYIDQTTRPGLISEMGNSCPSGFFYAGAGRCRSVECQYRGIFGSNDPLLASKGHVCPAAPWGGGFGTRGTLVQGSTYVPAANDPACPQRVPLPGWRSSCEDSPLPR